MYRDRFFAIVSHDLGSQEGTDVFLLCRRECSVLHMVLDYPHDEIDPRMLSILL